MDTSTVSEQILRELRDDNARLERDNAQLLRDVSALADARSTLLHERQLRDRIMEICPSGIVVLNREGELVQVNARAERILGLSRVNAGKRRHNASEWHITTWDGAAVVDEDLPFTRVRLTGQPQYAMQYAIHLPDGRRNLLSINAAPLCVADGAFDGTVCIIEDVTELRVLERQIAYLSRYDILTGLPNRSSLIEHLHKLFTGSDATVRSMALLFIDIDNFKLFNDAEGPAGGDRLLRILGQRLQACLGPEQMAARLGSDEFALITPLGAQGDAIGVAERVQAALSVPLRLGDYEFSPTASIGVALGPADGTDAQALLYAAEVAMYQAKSDGRNCYRFFAERMNSSLHDRFTLQAELQSAVSNEEWELHYQPKVDLRTGIVTGVEALLRWRHPQRGLLGPAAFVSILEDSGLMLQVGEWALREACTQLHAWHRAGHSQCGVSVNLSALQFGHPDLPGIVRSVLAEAQLEARFLELELTESMIMQDPAGGLETLGQLKKMGVGIALDDFGTGYSSLSYLRRFPIDVVKIDKSFIEGVTTDPGDASIAMAIIAMAHSLRMRVVAEGVETEGQINFLRRHHCDGIQGYYISRPKPAADIQPLLDKQQVLPQTESQGAGEALLLVDDEPNVLTALKRLLRREGYRIFTAASGAEALEILAREPVGVILSDQRMPEMNGTELLSRVRVMYPETVRMILSGYTDLNSVTEAINKGWVYKFLTKPWDDSELRADIRDAFARFGQLRGSSATDGETA